METTVRFGDLINEREAAKYLGLKVQTLRNWRHLGKGPRFFKLGKTIRYSKKMLDEYLGGSLIDPTEKGE